jgi:DNA-binding transcriptional LysR family regulator
LLRDRNVDFLLGALANPVMEEDLDVEVLYDDRPFIVSGSNNRWARRRKVDLSELVDEPWLLPLDSILQSVLAEAFQSEGLEPPTRGVRSYSVYQRLSLLTTGRFLASLPGSVLQFNVDQFSLKILHVEEPNAQSRGALLHRLRPRRDEAVGARQFTIFLLPTRRGATIRKARGGKAVGAGCSPICHVRREASRADCREEYAAGEN